MERLASLQCQVVGVTGDSMLSIRKVHFLPVQFTMQKAATCGFPILSDKSLVMAKAFGVKRRSGMMARGSFLLDKERRVLHCSVYPRHLTPSLHPGHLRCVARSAEEVVRQVESRGGSRHRHTGQSRMGGRIWAERARVGGPRVAQLSATASGGLGLGAVDSGSG